MAEIKTFKISELPAIGKDLDNSDMLLVADRSEKNAALSTKHLEIGELVDYTAKSSSLQSTIAQAIASKIKDSKTEIAKAVDSRADARVEYVIEHAILSAGNALTL